MPAPNDDGVSFEPPRSTAGGGSDGNPPGEPFQLPAPPPIDNSPEVLRLRGCLSQGASALLLLTSAVHAATLLWAPHLLLGEDASLLGGLDQLAFQAMLLGFAGVLWRPLQYRPFLLLGKAGFCFQIALGTGGQSYTEAGPRWAAITFMAVAMWYLLSRLGIGVLRPRAGVDEPPP